MTFMCNPKFAYPNPPTGNIMTLEHLIPSGVGTLPIYSFKLGASQRSTYQPHQQMEKQLENGDLQMIWSVLQDRKPHR
jgi:hypothetical protein